ncbi:hypothetical protein VOLCADRAFT_87514 [Volvox carteri f. nagariensis]|uniref:Cyanobacterial aminoacyl-tRNA synthetase CAAD domain-containing protein n=1 Tax=Volvox carteri f. nagariensis TaxID=3068 RepID=D8TLI1_VOLCA|nr:uncharacterized protein VOLCADRAFT_87514 [Volvox carteri f. nagariensis]EFJ51877.1 hypothetical protein VOLCADRAFT_87514 [Volvox carteri f. nagariensis]|eukprot:XP_002947287.1 hypothetical protein VOLCADRAFT_87514 [Volvox carteri f. nagariensis]
MRFAGALQLPAACPLLRAYIGHNRGIACTLSVPPLLRPRDGLSPKPMPNSPPSLSSSSGHIADREYIMSNSEGKSPVEEAIEEMQREERVRDMQRSVVEAVERGKNWWRDLPDKRTFVVGGVGLVVAGYLSNLVLSGVERVPLLPGLLQVVGFGFSCWFGWRYVLFAEGRQDLRQALWQLRRNVAEGVEGLAEKTLDTHPNPGTGETGAAATARRVADGVAAARRDVPTTNPQPPGQPRDDGSWVDEQPPHAGSGTARITGLDEHYVSGLLEELDEHSRGTTTGGRSPTSIFAFRLVSEADDGDGLRAPEPGADETAAAVGGGGGGAPASRDTGSSRGAPTGPASAMSAASAPSAPRGSTTGIRPPDGSDGGGKAEGGAVHHDMADLDPCLGWDVEACAASGHLKLGKPDTSKLDSLELAALRQAKEAVLHEPTSHGHASLESVHLEGEYGRAAVVAVGYLGQQLEGACSVAYVWSPGTLVSSRRQQQGPRVTKSNRKPVAGEEAGIGP